MQLFRVSQVANRFTQAAILLVLLGFTSRRAHADRVDDLLQIIQQASNGVQGSRAARAACEELSKLSIDVLPRLLEAMDGAGQIPGNWLRTVYSRITDRELAKSNPDLPKDYLLEFAKNPERAGRVRRLVVDLLEQVDPGTLDGMLPTMLDDPEFREQAIAKLLSSADQEKENGNSQQALRSYELAFEHARDAAQVTDAANKIKALGGSADVVAHLGFIVDWYVVGPFDAPGKSGFSKSFPPQENPFHIQDTFSGKNGETLAWKPYHSADPLGLIGLYDAIKQDREVVGYAYCEFESPSEQPAELRCGADDNCSVWLNGERVFAREQWLNGIRMDRFTTPVTLKPGVNQLLVKICQGPDHRDPEVGNNWTLQLRICNQQGKGLGLKTTLPLQPNQNQK